MESTTINTESTDICKGLDLGYRVSLVVTVEAALLSAIAVIALLSYIILNAFKNKYSPSSRRGTQPWHFIRSPVDCYFLSLLLNDLIQAMGAILSIRWIYYPNIVASQYCFAQGVLKQLGDVGVALATLAIGFHTFFVLCFRWRAPKSKWLPLAVIAIIWISLALSIVIPATRKKEYFAPSPPWCSYNPNYLTYQIALKYAPLWTTAITNLVLYIILFFCLRGNLIISFGELENSRRWIPRIQWKAVKSQNAWQRNAGQRAEQMVIARQMLGYPIAYIIMILPLSAVRLFQFTHRSSNVPSAAVGLAGVLFGLSGFINVLLYIATRPAVLRSVRMCIAGPRRRRMAAPSHANAAAGGMTMPEVTVDEAEPRGEYDDQEGGEAYEYEGGGITIMTEHGDGSLRMRSHVAEGSTRYEQTLDVPARPPLSHSRTPSGSKEGYSWSPLELSFGGVSPTRT